LKLVHVNIPENTYNIILGMGIETFEFCAFNSAEINEIQVLAGSKLKLLYNPLTESLFKS